MKRHIGKVWGKGVKAPCALGTPNMFTSPEVLRTHPLGNFMAVSSCRHDQLLTKSIPSQPPFPEDGECA